MNSEENKRLSDEQMADAVGGCNAEYMMRENNWVKGTTLKITHAGCIYSEPDFASAALIKLPNDTVVTYQGTMIDGSNECVFCYVKYQNYAGWTSIRTLTKA